MDRYSKKNTDPKHNEKDLQISSTSTHFWQKNEKGRVSAGIDRVIVGRTVLHGYLFPWQQEVAKGFEETGK